MGSELMPIPSKWKKATVEAPVIVLETEPEQLLKVLAQHEAPTPGPAG